MAATRESDHVKSVDMSGPLYVRNVYILYERDDQPPDVSVVCEACSMLFQSDWFWHHESCAVYKHEIDCPPIDFVWLSECAE